MSRITNTKKPDTIKYPKYSLTNRVFRKAAKVNDINTIIINNKSDKINTEEMIPRIKAIFSDNLIEKSFR